LGETYDPNFLVRTKLRAIQGSEPSGREIETDQNLGHSGLTPLLPVDPRGA
jgi:hypothetical protein